MEDNSERIATTISRVFDIYRTAGVLDESEILENVSFFALLWHFDKFESLNLNLDVNPSFQEKRIREDLIRRYLDGVLIAKEFGNIDGNLLPKATPSLKSYEFRQVAELLRDIFSSVDKLGEWFDQDLIPHLSATSKGGRYATPRHLVRFMAGVAGIMTEDSIADFACGTGGMLVARGKVKNATGIEISPNMARLAFTNLVLHEQSPDLYLGNAFDVAGSNSKFIESKFDVVVMNPPFGARMDPGLVSQAFEKSQSFYDFKGSSETMFTALAYEKLKPGGRMAVLVPSGVLFSNNRGEQFLRRMLVEEGALQAVISLSVDSMQPVNNLATHVLYAIKSERKAPTSNGVWFYRPRSDGFSKGRNRKPEPDENDLPIIEIAINAPNTGKGVQVAPLLGIHRTGGFEDIVGYKIESEDDTDFNVREVGSGFLVEVQRGAETIEWICLLHDEIYRGENSPGVLPPNLGEITDTNGAFNLRSGDDDASIEHISENEISYADFAESSSLLIKDGKGEVRKGDISKAQFGNTSKGEQDATGVLIDREGKLISGIIPFKVDKITEKRKPHLFEVRSEDRPRLLLFYGSFEAHLLESLSGKSIYMFRTDDQQDIIAFYYPDSGNIFPSIEDEFGYNENYPIFSSDKSRRGVVFHTYHGPKYEIGTLITQEKIIENNFDLQWSNYKSEYSVTEVSRTTLRSAAQILGDIKRNQNKLTSTLDRLLSISETQAVASAQLPPRLQAITATQELLQGIQQSIWEIALSQVEQAGDHETPTAFQADDIYSKLNDNASVMDVQRTLELFERMGLIIAVTYEGVPYYRLPTERDILTEAGQ